MDSDTPKPLFSPIGVIRSPFKQKFATPRQSGLTPSAQATLIFDKNQVPQGSFDELSVFSHLWLITYFHKSGDTFQQGKIQPPRLNGEKVGVFASRSPHRPNNIGLSAVELIGVDNDKYEVHVRGADLIDGTPVLDIKPYIAEYDSIVSANNGWLDQLETTSVKVSWSQDSEILCQKLDVPETVHQLVEECLSHDLRNLEDKKKSLSDEVFKTMISEWDFHFKYLDKQNVEVVHIERIKS